MLEFENLISIGQVNFLQGFECLENIESECVALDMMQLVTKITNDIFL